MERKVKRNYTVSKENGKLVYKIKLTFFDNESLKYYCDTHALNGYYDELFKQLKNKKYAEFTYIRTIENILEEWESDIESQQKIINNIYRYSADNAFVKLEKFNEHQFWTIYNKLVTYICQIMDIALDNFDDTYKKEEADLLNSYIIRLENIYVIHKSQYHMKKAMDKLCKYYYNQRNKVMDKFYSKPLYINDDDNDIV